MTQAVLKIHDVDKKFRTNNGETVEALQGISLAISPNDFVCIVGPSGCGKSTLLRIAAGLEQATCGMVMYREAPVTKPTAQIGMVFQEYSLLPWRTVLDNVALGLEFAGLEKSKCTAKGSEYLEMVGLTEFAQAYPHELSGGMRQRVAIARALAVEPDVLLMDEPFGALDAHTRILLQRELLRVWESYKKTVLFVTHSVDEAIYLADKIIVMSKRPGVIREIINVNLPRPRDRAVLDYGQLYAKILQMLDV